MKRNLIHGGLLLALASTLVPFFHGYPTANTPNLASLIKNPGTRRDLQERQSPEKDAIAPQIKLGTAEKPGGDEARVIAAMNQQSRSAQIHANEKGEEPGALDDKYRKILEVDVPQAVRDLILLKQQGHESWHSTYLGRANLLERRMAEFHIRIREEAGGSNPSHSPWNIKEIAEFNGGQDLLEMHLERSLITPSSTLLGTYAAMLMAGDLPYDSSHQLARMLAPLTLMENFAPHLTRTCIAVFIGGGITNG